MTWRLLNVHLSKAISVRGLLKFPWEKGPNINAEKLKQARAKFERLSSVPFRR